jgi:hypothetical protein
MAACFGINLIHCVLDAKFVARILLSCFFKMKDKVSHVRFNKIAYCCLFRFHRKMTLKPNFSTICEGQLYYD